MFKTNSEVLEALQEDLKQQFCRRAVGFTCLKANSIEFWPFYNIIVSGKEIPIQLTISILEDICIKESLYFSVLDSLIDKISLHLGIINSKTDCINQIYKEIWQA